MRKTQFEEIPHNVYVSTQIILNCDHLYGAIYLFIYLLSSVTK